MAKERKGWRWQIGQEESCCRRTRASNEHPSSLSSMSCHVVVVVVDFRVYQAMTMRTEGLRRSERAPRTAFVTMHGISLAGNEKARKAKVRCNSNQDRDPDATTLMTCNVIHSYLKKRVRERKRERERERERERGRERKGEKRSSKTARKTGVSSIHRFHCGLISVMRFMPEEYRWSSQTNFGQTWRKAMLQLQWRDPIIRN